MTCPVLALAFANWGAAASNAAPAYDDCTPKVPEIDYIQSRFQGFVQLWAGEFQRIEFPTDAKRTRVLTRLGQ